MQITKIGNKRRNITQTLEKLIVTKYYELLDANKLDNFDEQIPINTHIVKPNSRENLNRLITGKETELIIKKLPKRKVQH